MTERTRPRRPAIIEPDMLEYLEGDEDPQMSREAAHTTARALVPAKNGEWTDPDPQVLDRLLEIIETEGVDPLASLWASSPPETLPGVLWRLVLIKQWATRDPELLRNRHAQGLAATELGALLDPKVAKTIDLDEWIAQLTSLLNGTFAGDFAALLTTTAQELRVLAAHVAFGPNWITDSADTLATPITVRDSALLTTAKELEAAAQRYSDGRLD
ncbi:MAG: hypothetical protein Q4G30_00010 [Actinomycetaceae bacterium]|nr:hypothetical protein [Actinomycetaceae bacterium]